MSKILDGAKEALDVARGVKPAAKITSFVGGPYVKDKHRPVIQHRFREHYIVWNWDTEAWEEVLQPISILPDLP